MKSHKKISSSMERDRTHLLLWFKRHGFTLAETKRLCEYIKGMEARRNRPQAQLTSNFFLLQISYHTKLIQLLEGKVEANTLRGWDREVPYLTGAQDTTITKAKRLMKIERELKKGRPGKTRK